MAVVTGVGEGGARNGRAAKGVRRPTHAVALWPFPEAIGCFRAVEYPGHETENLSGNQHHQLSGRCCPITWPAGI